MSQSSTERFEKTYKEMYDSLKNTIPGIFSPVYEKEDGSTEQREIQMPEHMVSYFVENWYPHMEAGSMCNVSYFESEGKEVELFPQLTFYDVMKRLNSMNQEIVWDFVHNLFALSMSVKQVQDHYKETPDDADDMTKIKYEKIRETFMNFHVLVANLVSRKRERHQSQNEEKSTPPPPPQFDASFFENSALGALAKEIGESVKPEDHLNMDEMKDPQQMLASLLSGDQNSGIGKLMTTVCGKLQSKIESGEVDQAKLMGEAQQLLSGLSQGGGLNMPGFENLAETAQNLANFGNLFSGMGGGKNNSARARRRRAERMAKKAAKKTNKSHSSKPSEKKSTKKKPTNKSNTTSTHVEQPSENAN